MGENGWSSLTESSFCFDFDGGWFRKCLSDERNAEVAIGLFQGGHFAHFECQCGNFELNPVADGKPVESLRDTVVPPRSSGTSQWWTRWSLEMLDFDIPNNTELENRVERERTRLSWRHLPKVMTGCASVHGCDSRTTYKHSDVFVEWGVDRVWRPTISEIERGRTSYVHRQRQWERETVIPEREREVIFDVHGTEMLRCWSILRIYFL